MASAGGEDRSCKITHGLDLASLGFRLDTRFYFGRILRNRGGLTMRNVAIVEHCSAGSFERCRASFSTQNDCKGHGLQAAKASANLQINPGGHAVDLRGAGCISG